MLLVAGSFHALNSLHNVYNSTVLMLQLMNRLEIILIVLSGWYTRAPHFWYLDQVQAGDLQLHQKLMLFVDSRARLMMIRQGGCMQTRKRQQTHMQKEV